MLKYIIAALSILLLVSCAPQPVAQCPVVNCPVLTCPDQVANDDNLYLSFIDVGQGDAILIRYKATEMLIDCGKNSEGQIVVDFLKQKKVSELEYLMETHQESDHIGGCDEVLQQIKTDAVISSGEIKDTTSYRDVVSQMDIEQSIIAHEGSKWNIGPATLEVIETNSTNEDSNLNSIVSLLTYGNTKILLTGDCDNSCEDNLLSRNITANILKVAHHGSKYGTEINFLEMVKPSVAIISVGVNSYGHPTQEVLDRLSQEGITTYRTDTSGTITFTINLQTYFKTE